MLVLWCLYTFTWKVIALNNQISTCFVEMGIGLCGRSAMVHLRKITYKPKIKVWKMIFPFKAGKMNHKSVMPLRPTTQPFCAGWWLKERQRLSECVHVLMYCTDVTHVVDLWAWLIQLDMQHLLHGCANSLTKSLTRFHHFALLFPSTPFRFHPPLLRPNSRTFWTRWNTICWLISQAIASHALIFTSRRTASYQLSWEANWEANWAKGKGHFRALWGKDVSTMTLHLITFCQLVANTTVFKLWEKNVAVLSRGWLPQRWQLWFLSLLLPTGCERLQLGWWEPLAGSQGHMQIACHMLFLAKVQDLGKIKFIWLMFFIQQPTKKLSMTF